MIANFPGHDKVVVFLVEKGASVDFKNENGQSSIYIAAENGNKNSCEENLSFFLIFIFSGHRKIVEYLLKREANVAVREKNWHTPLYIAIENVHEDIAMDIIEYFKSKDQFEGLALLSEAEACKSLNYFYVNFDKLLRISKLCFLLFRS